MTDEDFEREWPAVVHAVKLHLKFSSSNAPSDLLSDPIFTSMLRDVLTVTVDSKTLVNFRIRANLLQPEMFSDEEIRTMISEL